MVSHSDQAIDAIPDPQLCESCGEVTYDDDDMCGECLHGFYESLRETF